jgi:hypothetical protein
MAASRAALTEVLTPFAFARARAPGTPVADALEDLGVADTDIHGVCRLLDRARLQESELEDAPITIGKGGENHASAPRSIAGLVRAGWLDKVAQV